MAERKVLNKYYPPDYDPDKIVFYKGSTSAKHKVRLMAPFSMRCNACGNFIYKGSKFNARKEKIRGEAYLGIQVFRFFIRCPRCAAEISYKTDPKNADYVCEFGASRNFESWRQEQKTQEDLSFRKRIEEELDPMKKLEKKTLDSKKEIEILEELDEMRSRNAIHEKVAAGVDLESLIHSHDDDKIKNKMEKIKRLEDEEDERMAKEAFEQARNSIKRIREEDLNEDKPSGSSHHKAVTETNPEKKQKPQNSLGIVKKPPISKNIRNSGFSQPKSAVKSLVSSYSSSDEE